MLQLTIPGREYFDEVNEEFIYTKTQTLTLEHSLLSVKKWESKWKIPFLSRKKQKTYEQSVDYVRCMTITPNVDPLVYSGLTKKNFDEVNAYIDDTMTATWFSEDEEQKMKRSGGSEITAELIYFWMVSYRIPFECQKWHLNNLLTLIRICEIKNTPSKKMKKKDIYARNRALNAARRRSLGTSG